MKGWGARGEAKLWLIIINYVKLEIINGNFNVIVIQHNPELSMIYVPEIDKAEARPKKLRLIQVLWYIFEPRDWKIHLSKLLYIRG